MYVILKSWMVLFLFFYSFVEENQIMNYQNFFYFREKYTGYFAIKKILKKDKRKSDAKKNLQKKSRKNF
jgi:predicted GNAT superfamily acetyltransferase